MKLLIGYDGSECADSAIENLQFAGIPENTEAVVLSVADVWRELPASYAPPVDPLTGSFGISSLPEVQNLAAEAIKDAQELSSCASQRLGALFPAWRIQTDWYAGSPYQSIVTRAEGMKADLIVIGSHGRSAIGRMLFGSVSQKVLHYAPCSVRISRQRPGNYAGPLRIVVGVDASPHSKAAISAVAQRKWPPDTEVRVVMAMDLRLNTALPMFVRDASGSEVAGFFLQAAQEAKDVLRRGGLAATTVVKAGDPKKVLIEEAAESNADCIFLGARGLSPGKQFLMGSVSSMVAARAHCSVEVVRPG